METTDNNVRNRLSFVDFKRHVTIYQHIVGCGMFIVVYFVWPNKYLGTRKKLTADGDSEFGKTRKSEKNENTFILFQFSTGMVK